ncbi:hypothetical protein CL633_00425 [bacterium]|nr:hypothetical protein [bacterium]|tara:strand:- start:5147 stop:5812 length:666 start_codon:yes stop_codon:yes gene_type:complete
MFYLVPQVLIILSLGGILFIFLRKMVKMNNGVDREKVIITKLQNKDKKPAFAYLQKIFTGKQKKNKKIHIKKVLKKISKLVFSLCSKIVYVFILIVKIIKKIFTRTIKDLKGIFKTTQKRIQSSHEKAKQKKIDQKKDRKELEKKKLKKQKKESNVQIMIAEKECIDRIAKDPKDIQAYLSLGKIYKKQKHVKDAKACFGHVLKIKPKNKSALKEIKKIEK